MLKTTQLAIGKLDLECKIPDLKPPLPKGFFLPLDSLYTWTFLRLEKPMAKSLDGPYGSHSYSLREQTSIDKAGHVTVGVCLGVIYQ